MDYNEIRISPDNTHHILHEKPLYAKRFVRVMSYHDPGVAAVMDDQFAYHIDVNGEPIYDKRFLTTFGFYDRIAAVQDDSGYYHIDTNGNPKYPERFSWAGNFQEGLCVVRDSQKRYFHIDREGRPAYNERYAYVGDFKYGVASVYTSDGLATHIDRAGRFIHGKWFLECGVYHKGYAVTRDEAGYFHIDMIGVPLYDDRYAWVEPFYNGIAFCKTLDGKLVTRTEDGTISPIAGGDIHES